MNTELLYRLLKANALVSSHRVKFALILGLYWLRRRHLSVRVDPSLWCNLRCQMCYFSDPDLVRDDKLRLDSTEMERLAEVLFPWALQLYVGCQAEPTTHKEFTKVIALGRRHKVPMIGMTTNGQLLTADHLEEMVELGLDELTLSTHGVTRNTYEHLMRRASFDRFIDVLGMLEAVKKRRRTTKPELRVNYTVNPDNLEELQHFFDVFGTYSVRTLQIRPIVDWGRTEYTDKDLTPHVARYNEILHGIEQQCRRRGIRLLANYEDAAYRRQTSQAAVASQVLVYVDPRNAPLPGFAWPTESYLEYRRRTHWPGTLVKGVFTSAATLASSSPWLSYKVIG